MNGWLPTRQPTFSLNNNPTKIALVSMVTEQEQQQQKAVKLLHLKE
jgi:hypothetical protein